MVSPHMKTDLVQMGKEKNNCGVSSSKNMYFRAEGENPVLPQPAPSSSKSDDGDDQFEEDPEEQCK